MAGRGSYAKGVAKREEILRTALEVFAKQGYRGTSLRELADAVNLSQAGLLHYFDSKEELFAEILRVRDETDRAAYSSAGSGVDTMLAVIRHNSAVPGLVQLYATISSAATEPSHPAHEFFVERYRLLREAFADSARERQLAGELDANLDPAKVAAVMLAVADGMQVQWLLDADLDMAEHVEFVWSLMATARGAGQANGS
ncbi:MAG TPA: helix-turn-helix domain-containing protein [Galbitalea sp.]|jgi:AcrR family transcriptional regulator|nr:helix-turn-helix domain-containing protein [Galbitalea sp.]